MPRLYLLIALALIFTIGTYAAIKISNRKAAEHTPHMTPPSRNEITQSAEQALGSTVLDKGEIGAIGTQHIFTDSVAVALMQGIRFVRTEPSNRYDADPDNIYELTLNFDNLSDRNITVRKDSGKQFRLETLDDSTMYLRGDRPYLSAERLNTVTIPAKGRKDVTLRFATQAKNPKLDMLVFNRKGPFTPNTVYWRL